MKFQSSNQLPKAAVIGRRLGFSHRGFSLTELLIVVAILGIIAALAYPSYQTSVEKSRRADAKAALLELAQFMERTYVENKTYRPGGVTPALPFTEAPKDSGNKYYDLAFSAIGANSFTLIATPKAGQASDHCGKLTLAQTGQKGVVDAHAGVTVADCW